MTVITLSQKLELRSFFDRNATAAAVQPRRSIKKFLRSFMAFVTIVSLLGIFVSGIASIKLVFLIKSHNQTIEAMKRERESLVMQVSELARPDILAGYADMLELRPVEKPNFVTLGGPAVAGR